MLNDSVLSAMEAIPCLGSLRADQKNGLGKVAQPRRFEAGELIFGEWKRAQHLYFVVSGSITLTSAKAADREIGCLYRGDLFGWSAVVDPTRYSTATARAASPAEVLLFERQSLHRLMEEDHELGFRLMKHVAQVLAERLGTVFVQFNITEADLSRRLAS